MSGMFKRGKDLLGISVLAGLLLAACESVPPPTLSPGTGPSQIVVEPMQVNDIQVVGLDQDPPQPAAVIDGVIGDSCNELDSVTQTRDGNAISIQITVRRTTGPNIACAELAQLYNETLPLEGDFPSGEYTLVVNGTPRTFSIGAADAPADGGTADCIPN